MAEIRYDDLLELEEEDFDTVLASDIQFSGTIKFKEPLMIKGKVQGQIEATSDLSISEEAVVKAHIQADRVLIKGCVEGDVCATTVVHVFACGSLTGDIEAPDVILEKGCYFNGICSMRRQD